MLRVKKIQALMACMFSNLVFLVIVSFIIERSNILLMVALMFNLLATLGLFFELLLPALNSAVTGNGLFLY